MLPSWARQTATLLTPVIVDDHGTEVPDWDEPPVETTVTGCSFQPSTGSVDDDNREGVRGGAGLFLPPHTPVSPHQRVRVEGTTYRILGQPEQWTSATGALDHIVLRLEHWEG